MSDPVIVSEAGDFVLCLVEGRLQLREKTSIATRGLEVNFAEGALDYRRRYGGQGGQLILKAVGGSGKKVLDATAGLARDAFILASLGCQVTAVEKSPVIAALVKDAMERGRTQPPVKKILDRMTLIVGDSLVVMTSASDWDVIYLDPMFPPSDKSALPKKEMQILHRFFQESAADLEPQNALLLDAALSRAPRVVVKRPAHGPPLKGGADLEFKGNSTRFDVYLKK